MTPPPSSIVHRCGTADGPRLLLVSESPISGDETWILAVDSAAGKAGLRVEVLYQAGCWWTDPIEREPPLLAFADEPAAIAGIGIGGQAALLAAFERPDRFPAVAAIAPACDLGRWYDRMPSLQQTFTSAEQARQWEAPLRLNPLRRPRSVWVGCDPRDQPCTPSALRVTTKLTSSGIAVEHDLTSELGDDRNDYAAATANVWIPFLADAINRVDAALPIL